jgi:hypothetical protein
MTNTLPLWPYFLEPDGSTFIISLNLTKLLISYLFPYVVCYFFGHGGNVRVWIIFKNTQSMPNLEVDTGRGRRVVCV